jgi:peptidoglycan hydrolase-like protein with peptidoglycan-binding domain
VNGIFNRTMRRAVRAFQLGQWLPGDGQLGSETWVRLMDYTPTAMNWAASASTASSLLSANSPLGASSPMGGPPVPAAHKPLSATLPAVRNELAP